MIYTIAAYSITLGVLAIYGVLLLHRQRIATATLARSRRMLAPVPRKGFNLGAALLAPLWMWAHGLRIPGALLLLSTLAIVPLHLLGWRLPMWLLLMTVVAAAGALGVVGNRIAADHRQPEDLGAFAIGQFPWAVAGIGLHVLVMPWVYFSMLR